MQAPAERPRGVPATTNVLALLCAMYFINYIVRVNVSTAAAVFQPELHLTNTQVGLIFSAFAYPYLAFQIAGGWVADRFGARRALTVFAIVWSVATVLMGLANSVVRAHSRPRAARDWRFGTARGHARDVELDAGGEARASRRASRTHPRGSAMPSRRRWSRG